MSLWMKFLSVNIQMKVTGQSDFAVVLGSRGKTQKRTVERDVAKNYK